METKKEQQVIATYDLCGLQNYIFRTNRLKDIIGASVLVDEIFKEALNSAMKKCEIPEANCELKWEEKVSDLKDGDILPKGKDIQILYEGGGSQYILYRDKETARKINRHMAKYVMEHSYSLQLAMAMVDKTDDYAADIRKLQLEIEQAKREMPYAGYLGALPIMKTDLLTGFPISKERTQGFAEEVSQEVLCKRKYMQNETEESKQSEQSKQLNSFGKEFGKDSTIAIVHIDGNNMGLRIKELIGNGSIKDYPKAIAMMRQISKNIKRSFQETYEQMEKKLHEHIESGKSSFLKQNQAYLRKIIIAGDDITFVCNAQIALSLVEFFAEDISKKQMYNPTESEEEKDKYSFSVCAGIAYIHSHFPFSTGYQVAEACCGNAKKRAKKLVKEQRYNNIGNWVDFQICKSVHTQDLENDREKDYLLAGGNRLELRPYRIGTSNDNEEGKKYDSLNWFKKCYLCFSNTNKDKNKIADSAAQTLRNIYPLGAEKVQEYVEFIKSRGKKLPGEEAFKSISTSEQQSEKAECKGKTALWYDALEMLGLYEKIMSDEE